MTKQAETDHRSPGYAKRPGYRVDFELSPRRVRVEFNGEIIADTTAAMLMREDTPTRRFITFRAQT